MTVAFNFTESDTQETVDCFLQASKMHTLLLDIDRSLIEDANNPRTFDKKGARERLDYFNNLLKTHDVKLFKECV